MGWLWYVVAAWVWLLVGELVVVGLRWVSVGFDDQCSMDNWFPGLCVLLWPVPLVLGVVMGFLMGLGWVSRRF